MANVMFKRGLSTALPATGVDGTFYLTTDTNRLYVCNAKNELVELNQSINTVPTLGDLPSGTSGAQKGQYYYVSGSNVLAYYDGTQWKQINPDTKLTAKEQHNTGAAITDGYKISTRVEDTIGNESKGNFSIKGSDAITVTGTGTEITVDAHDTKYTLDTESTTHNSKAAAKIVLDSDVTGETAQEVLFVGGDNVTIDVVKDGNNTVGVKINAAQDDGMFNTGVSEAFDANGKHTTTVTDGNGPITSTGVTPTITYGNGKSAVFANGTAALDVYDKAQVDGLISMADAMHYMGTVSSSDATTKLDIKNAQNGDTYKASTYINNGTVVAQIGDLIIAKGTEGDNGKLTTGVWEVIPSGDSQVVNVTANATTHQITIEDNAAGSSGNLGSIKLVDGGENIKLTSTASDGKNLVTTIAHDTAGTAKATLTGSTTDVTQTEQTSKEFEAITSLSYDANGHIVSANKTKLTVVDTHNELTAINVTSTGGASDDTIGTAVEVTTQVVMSDGNKSGKFKLDSDTLRLKQNSATVSIDMVWGSF